MKNKANKLTWLNVTGCPRSGTTALSTSLNESKNISLLHEHYPDDFFSAIDKLFKNERFHFSLGDLPSYENEIICKVRDEEKIIRSIFSITFGKESQVIGVKFPGLQRWEKTVYPNYIDLREIHITRNPIDVVNSYTTKGDGTISEDPERAFCDWLNSFNHAVLRYGNDDFHWVLYESFKRQENHDLAREIAEFLGIPMDFTLESIGAKSEKAEFKSLNHENGEHTLKAIESLFDMENWESDSIEKIKSRSLIGYPLHETESIFFSLGGNSWKYIQHGFYPEETDGSWTCGSESIICFTPDKPFSDHLTVLVDASWILDILDEPTSFKVYLDDYLIGESAFRPGRSNGHSIVFIFNVCHFKQKSKSVTMKIIIDNPRNPRKFGISEDNRNLGLMVRSISFQK